MRLKIIALASLLTIAVPVEAEPGLPPLPEDPTDPKQLVDFAQSVAGHFGGCAGLAIAHNSPSAAQNLASMALYMTTAKDQEPRTYYFELDAYVGSYNAIYVHIVKDAMDFDLCGIL